MLNKNKFTIICRRQRDNAQTHGCGYGTDGRVKTIFDNPNWSKSNNDPIDSLTFYFPFIIKKDSSTIKTNIDSLTCGGFSKILFEAEEKVLYNSYGGHDIYRLIWAGSFNPPIIVSLHKEGDKIWITSKSLDKYPAIIRMKSTIRFFNPNDKSDTISQEQQDSLDIVDSIRMAEYYRKPKIENTTTKYLSINEWNKFEQLLDSCNYWELSPFTEEVLAMDGSYWTIEAHLKNKYWFVHRLKFSPHDNYQKCGEYLIDLVGLKEDVY